MAQNSTSRETPCVSCNKSFHYIAKCGPLNKINNGTNKIQPNLYVVRIYVFEPHCTLVAMSDRIVAKRRDETGTCFWLWLPLLVSAGTDQWWTVRLLDSIYYFIREEKTHWIFFPAHEYCWSFNECCCCCYIWQWWSSNNRNGIAKSAHWMKHSNEPIDQNVNVNANVRVHFTLYSTVHFNI